MGKITLSTPADQVTRDLTAAEETKKAAKEAQTASDKQAEIDAKVAADAKLASGKIKLKDLGLDDDEIKALTGV